jgi:hypothetical protein
MAQTITEDTRKQIYDELADLMIAAVDGNDMPVKEMKQSARFILDNLDAIKTEDELMQFLQTVGEKWKAYAVALLKYEGRKKMNEDEAKIQELQNKLSSFMHA